MHGHETFRFHSLDEVRRRIAEFGLDLSVDEDIRILLEPVALGGVSLPNRLVVLPMEGCDGLADGSPDELTFRRYRRFAAGGAGLLWVEATAVVPEGRANPRQLWIHEGTLSAFARLVEHARAAAARDVRSEPPPVARPAADALGPLQPARAPSGADHRAPLPVPRPHPQAAAGLPADHRRRAGAAGGRVRGGRAAAPARPASTPWM